jgi:hypothetical protein
VTATQPTLDSNREVGGGVHLLPVPNSLFAGTSDKETAALLAAIGDRGRGHGSANMPGGGPNLLQTNDIAQLGEFAGLNKPHPVPGKLAMARYGMPAAAF